MWFGRIAASQAEGCLLAHSVRCGAASYKKGRRLVAADVQALEAAGVREVVVARLAPDDMHEDEAAGRLARAATGDGLRVGNAFTGRCNLFATRHGVLVIDAARLERVNLLDEAITLATLPPWSLVAPRQMVATVKIIPFAVPVSRLLAAESLLAGGTPVARIATLRALRVGLVQTRLPGMRESVLDKTRGVTAHRLDALGCTLARERRCAHEEYAVAQAIAALLAERLDMVLVAGASAIVDRRDVVPAGIERAGGVVEHFGMPVDPGNLLLLARHGPVPVLGLPGCARSPKYNGLDAVLQRLVAGLPVQREDIMRMGAGGLLSEIASRPAPRARADEPPPAAAPAPRIAALVLAAGQSRRMGRANKLLAEVDGAPMVARVLQAVLGSSVGEVVVVTGHEAQEVEQCLRGWLASSRASGERVRFVHNPGYGEGLSTSLAAGLDALSDAADAALVCLGDMPRVTAADLERLIGAYEPVEGRAICVPAYGGKRGNPVLWSRAFFPEMRAVKGDVGARHLIGEHEDQVYEVEMAAPGVLLDVDSPQALAGLRKAGAQR